MPAVETVRGPVDAAALGRTLMHEHVFVLGAEYVQNHGAGDWWDEEEKVADAVGKLRELAGLGVTTIADPTVWGLGRYIPRIQRINEQVPELNIIVATGIYTYNDVPFQFHHRGPGTMVDVGPDPMIADFTRDLTEGIAGTGVKAAFLKCAVDAPGLTPGVERVLRAVAAAHRETGAPVTVHTESSIHAGRTVVGLLGEEGVDLAKVVVGHAGDSNDLDYLMELADTGAILGMDRFGLDILNPTAQRVATVAALCERGYADRMVLSHDASCFMDWFGPDPATVPAMQPNWNYRHISEDVLPALRAAGVSDAQLDQMLVDNPRRYFTR
ncbi:phosphotriesterase family protein [Actinomadura coerulea]|uniref:Phosphotriesterase-related protein n=1 Tax=Actinomadura coerulea TaxID=46159 RepID=A0A7X0KZ33_9ACTN|nr:phosphotriesterase [Actinomadura coerulea]MBB6396048.1 phosphotriesterase-related protein [Actinomadura coerulea]GGQ41474.1 phosphotriesterase [Actinomadura coerulea]